MTFTPDAKPAPGAPVLIGKAATGPAPAPAAPAAPADVRFDAARLDAIEAHFAGLRNHITALRGFGLHVMLGGYLMAEIEETAAELQSIERRAAARTSAGADTARPRPRLVPSSATTADGVH